VNTICNQEKPDIDLKKSVNDLLNYFLPLLFRAAARSVLTLSISP
jgi:hypothetical protein